MYEMTTPVSLYLTLWTSPTHTGGVAGARCDSDSHTDRHGAFAVNYRGILRLELSLELGLRWYLSQRTYLVLFPAQHGI